MKYALFAWEPYEAHGGAGDLQCTGSLDDCKAAFAEYVESHLGDGIGEIADMGDLRVIATADITSVRAPHKDPWEPTDSWAITWV